MAFEISRTNKIKFTQDDFKNKQTFDTLDILQQISMRPFIATINLCGSSFNYSNASLTRAERITPRPITDALLEDLKKQKAELLQIQSAVAANQESSAAPAWQKLCPAIQEVFSYFVWHHHRCPQTYSFDYGKEAIQDNYSILSTITTPYLHLTSGDILSQMIALVDDKISLFDSENGNYQEMLDHQKAQEITHFKLLVDRNCVTHKHLHKLYKALDPKLASDMEARYHPPYYGKGIHSTLYKEYGAHIEESAVRFKVYAPHAENVSIAIRKYGRDVEVIPMEKTGKGDWELTTDRAKKGTAYQYLITAPSGEILRKADPYARKNREAKVSEFNYLTEGGPNKEEMTMHFRHESVVTDAAFDWSDKEWMSKRAENAGKEDPRNVYELHVTFWKKDDGKMMSWETLAKELVAHCRKMNFTHVELIGVADHILDFPFTCYQPIAPFAPNHRLGTPSQFKAFVNYLHNEGIGVILDWVGGHFGINESGLSQFDGAPLYEHPNALRALQPEWHVMTYDFEQKRVRDFLISNAKYWAEEFHIDGFRTDAVTNMIDTELYREGRDSFPHKKGGRWNLDAMLFLRDLNALLHTEHPGILTIAEESSGEVPSTFSTTERPVSIQLIDKKKIVRGLGFDEKWSLGWMNLMFENHRFLWQAPEKRKDHRHILFNAMKVDRDDYWMYEKVTRAVSHDECTEIKGAVLNHMDGSVQFPENTANKFSDLRSFYLQQITLPGTKLSFMGNEFAQTESWDKLARIASGLGDMAAVDWDLVIPGSPHETYQNFMSAVNDLYLKEPALWGQSKECMQWFHTADFDSNEGRPLIAYFRKSSHDPLDQLICINHFGDTTELEYVIALPELSTNPALEDLIGIEEIFNSDDLRWEGNGLTNQNIEMIIEEGRPTAFKLTIPPQSGIILRAQFSKAPTIVCPLPDHRQLFVRTSEDWGQGTPLTRLPDHVWKLPSDMKPDVEYKLLLDNDEWEVIPSNQNRVLSMKDSAAIYPHFSSL